MSHFKDWNSWRKINNNSLLNQLAILLKLQKSPSLEYHKYYRRKK